MGRGTICAGRGQAGGVKVSRCYGYDDGASGGGSGGQAGNMRMTRTIYPSAAADEETDPRAVYLHTPVCDHPTGWTWAIGRIRSTNPGWSYPR